MNFYPFHIGDYRSATAHLTPQEDLSYRRLLDMYYDTESPLPNNLDFLSRRIRASSDEIHTVLKDFFSLRADFWYHERCEHEIEKYRKMSEGGKAGAAKRWLKGSDSPPIAPLNTPHAPPNSNQEPLTINHKPKNTARVRAIAKPDGVGESVWSDFLQIRKAKRSPLTQTALDGIDREAAKAGITLDQALSMCCERGWKGFKTEWLTSATSFSQMRADIATQTVPSKPGKCPALQKLDEDRARVVPMPENVRATLKLIRSKA